MKLLVALLVLFGLSVQIFCEKVSYENYRIYSIRLNNENQLNVLQTIERLIQDVLFITPPSLEIATVVAIPPWKLDQIYTILTENAINFVIKTDNLQR